MKILSIYLLCFSLLCALQLKAQDVIVPVKGNMFECKILKTDEQTIYYVFKSAPKVEYTMKREDVKELILGKTLDEVIQSKAPVASVDSSQTRNVDVAHIMFSRGYQDGNRCYRGYSGAGTGTFFSTVLLGGIGGLVTGLACSETPPRFHNLSFPDPKLMQNNDYKKGYYQAAHQKKRKAVWKNFGAGMGTLILLILVAGR